MTIGIAVAALILLYLSKFPIIALIGSLLSLALIGGVLYMVWNFCYPDNLWYFWLLSSIGVCYWIGLVLFGKAVDSVFK